MPFEIIRNDITNVKADAIVNTANPFPVIGAGTDAAIHQKAGPQLLEERKKIGYIAPGESAETPAFGLDAKYVLHTVTTGWTDGEHGEREILEKAYNSALTLAEKLECESVAFPLMAAGSYGFPPEIALGTAIQVITDHLLYNDIRIILVVFSGKAYSLAGALFDDVRSFVSDSYVQERTRYERRRREPLNLGLTGSRPSRKESTDDAAAENSAIYAYAAEMAEPSVDAKADLRKILRGRESTFVEYLRDVIREKGMTDPEVYRRASMSRQLFNKIINDMEYNPSKRTAIQLAVGLQLDMDETQKLLGKAGYALTRSSKQDLIVEYYLRNGEYNLLSIDLALIDAGLPTIVKSG